MGPVTYKEFATVLREREGFELIPRVLPLKKVLGTVKSERVFKVSDINRDDFVMFRYELNNIFKRNFYEQRSPLRTRNPPSPISGNTTPLRPTFSLQDFGSKEQLEERVRPPGIIESYALGGVEGSSLGPEVWNSSPLLYNKIIMRVKAPPEKALEYKTVPARAKLEPIRKGARQVAESNNNKKPRATPAHEMVWSSSQVVVGEPKLIEEKDFATLVRDERKELQETFEEDPKRERQRRLLQRYSEEKIERRLAEWGEKLQKERTKVKHYDRKELPMLVKYERELAARKEEYFNQVKQSQIDATVFLHRIMAGSRRHLSRHLPKK